MLLDVEIHDQTSGSRRTLQFAKSPIRIGRNQLNDISLDDPFVSEWHGIIRFDPDSIAYFDLGSTNGTKMGGQRLQKNVATALSGKVKLQLGLLELVVSQPTAPAPAPVAQAPTPSGPFKTLAWGHSLPSLPQGAVPPLSSAGPTPQPGSPEAARRMATGNVVGAAVSRLASTFSGTSGEARAAGSGPALPGMTGPDAGAGKLPPDAAGADNVQAKLAATERLLETFCEAFVGLRKGYEQFGVDVGVRTINGMTPLHRERTARGVMNYLLQPGNDPGVTIRDLISIFADFGIHHVAMMEGITEGARALLQSMDPRNSEVEPAGSRLFSRKSKAWEAYLERFDTLLTDDHELHATIFGEEFARAYASVTTGEVETPSQPPRNGGTKT